MKNISQILALYNNRAWHGCFFSLLVLPDQYQVGVYPEQDLPHPTPGGWQYHVKG